MFNSIKTQATAVGNVFEKHGIKLTRAEKLEYLAEIYGAKNYNELAVAAKPLVNAAMSVTSGKYRSEDQLRLNAPVEELIPALLANQGKEQAALFGQTQSLIARLLNSDVMKNHYELYPFEDSHAKGSAGNKYGPEVKIAVQSGFSLACPAHEEVDYVRVLDPRGQEIGYWTMDEFDGCAGEVIGGIMGMLCRGGFQTEGQLTPPEKPEPIKVTLSKVDGAGHVEIELRIPGHEAGFKGAYLTSFCLSVVGSKKYSLISFSDVRYKKDGESQAKGITLSYRKAEYVLDCLIAESFEICKQVNSIEAVGEHGLFLRQDHFEEAVEDAFGA